MYTNLYSITKIINIMWNCKSCWYRRKEWFFWSILKKI